MAVNNLFSKRVKRERGEMPDVYQYTTFDEHLRITIVHILKDLLRNTVIQEHIYSHAVSILRKERGVFHLPPTQRRRAYDEDELFEYFTNEQNTEQALDVVELCFSRIKYHTRDKYSYDADFKKKVSEAIKELNDRFQKGGFGYTYESGMIMKVTAEFTHNAIIKPALRLLANKSFEGAQQEFLSAYKHFRKHENKECIADCLKSFESTMKIICKIKKYEVDNAASANKLIIALSDNNFMPNYLDSQFNALTQLLSSGIPAIRNNLAGHGQGEAIKEVDDNYTGYALNITVSNIVFLASLLNEEDAKI